MKTGRERWRDGEMVCLVMKEVYRKSKLKTGILPHGLIVLSLRHDVVQVNQVLP